MLQEHELGNNKSLVLVTNENQIFLRRKNRETVSRPVLLARDFYKDLSSTYSNGQLYYSYITTQNHTVLCRFGSSHSIDLTEIKAILHFESNSSALQTNIQTLEQTISKQNDKIEHLEQIISSQKETINQLEQSSSVQKQQLNEFKNAISRAQTQYNELMQVANQYREEAIKWHSKFR